MPHPMQAAAALYPWDTLDLPDGLGLPLTQDDSGLCGALGSMLQALHLTERHRPGAPGCPEPWRGPDPGPLCPGALLTFVSVEEAADQGQDGERDEVAQAGRDGRGDVVWVDAELPSANHYTDHQQACGRRQGEQGSAQPALHRHRRTGVSGTGSQELLRAGLRPRRLRHRARLPGLLNSSSAPEAWEGQSPVCETGR